MSAKFEKVIELRVVIDHDCGNYSIGEVEVSGAYGPEIREFLQRFGEEGRDNLLKALNFCTHRVYEENTKIISEAHQAVQAFSSK